MPNAPLKICRDCQRTALPNSDYCLAHQTNNRAVETSRERNRRRRDEEYKRLYDTAQWRKRTVPFILQRDPICQIAIICEGRAFSTDVDHVVRVEIWIAEHGGDEAAFFDPDNLRGACHQCHSHKTSLENQGLWKEPDRRRGGGQNL